MDIGLFRTTARAATRHGGADVFRRGTRALQCPVSLFNLDIFYGGKSLIEWFILAEGAGWGEGDGETVPLVQATTGPGVLLTVP